MAGYQTIEALRPILHRGPPPAPVVDRALVGRDKPIPKLSRKVTPRKFTQEQVEEMRRLRAEGHSYIVIAGKVGCGEDTARRYAGDVAISAENWRPGFGKPRTDRKAFAERLRRSGFTYKEIGEEIGYSEGGTWHLLNGAKRERTNDAAGFHRLVHSVARAMGMSSSDLRARPNGRWRCKPALSKARFILFYIAYDKLGRSDTRTDGMSTVTLGRSIGGVHHTSVLNGLKRARAAIEKHNIDTSLGVHALARALWVAKW